MRPAIVRDGVTGGEKYRRVLEGLMQPSTNDLLARIQSEYLEQPGLRLTVAQARRLWNLEPTLCEALLSVLVARQVLARTTDGYYVSTRSG